MAGRNILLVEPELVVAEIAAFRLELLGYHIETVESGEQALTKIANQVPDLLITDLVLPGLDGVALIERLTESQATSDLPIMVLSIDADLARVQSVVGLGAKDFLVVPFDLEVLQSKVEKLLESAPVRARTEVTEVMQATEVTEVTAVTDEQEQALEPQATPALVAE